MGRHTVINWGSNAPIDWSGQTATIVASGPSAAATDFELLRGRRVIAINLSWQLVPWADVLYGMDGQFWHLLEGLPQFPGRKVTSSPMAAQSFGIDCLFCIGNNSGMRAINLAEAYGAKRILLIGFDMHVRAGVHWHAPHAGRLHNPVAASMQIWRTDMARHAPLYRKRGLTIINCTPGSALDCFPRMSLQEALNGTDELVGGTDKPRYIADAGRLVAG